MAPCAGHLLPRGERQQLSLARALYHNPKLILIDEFDNVLLERLPATMTKTFRSVMSRGGAIVFLSRHPLTLDLPRQQYRLEKGTLERVREIAPKSKSMGQNVTVIGEKGVGKAVRDD